MARARKIVHIEWVDSATHSGWHNTAHDPRGVAHCQSVGMVVRDNEKEIVIVQSWSDDETVAKVGESIAIPKAAVRRKRNIASIQRKP